MNKKKGGRESRMRIKGKGKENRKNDGGKKKNEATVNNLPFPKPRHREETKS